MRAFFFRDSPQLGDQGLPGGDIMRAVLRIARIGAEASVVQYVALGWLFAMVTITATYGIGQG
jgi:hypothetical protein